MATVNDSVDTNPVKMATQDMQATLIPDAQQGGHLNHPVGDDGGHLNKDDWTDVVEVE